MLKKVMLVAAIAVSGLSFGQESTVDRNYTEIIKKETAKLEYQLGVISDYEFDVRYTYLGWKIEYKASLAPASQVMYTSRSKDGKVIVVVVSYLDGNRVGLVESI